MDLDTIIQSLRLAPVGRGRRCELCDGPQPSDKPVCPQCRRSLPEQDFVRLRAIALKRIADKEKNADDADELQVRRQQLELLHELYLPSNYEELQPAVDRLLTHCGAPLDGGWCRHCLKAVFPGPRQEPLMEWFEIACQRAFRSGSDAFWTRCLTYIVATIAKKHGIKVEQGPAVTIRTGDIEIEGYSMDGGPNDRIVELAKVLQYMRQVESSCINGLHFLGRLKRVLVGYVDDPLGILQITVNGQPLDRLSPVDLSVTSESEKQG